MTRTKKQYRGEEASPCSDAELARALKSITDATDLMDLVVEAPESVTVRVEG